MRVRVRGLVHKRLKVGPTVLEQMEQRQTEGEDPQVGSRIVEALWALNTHLGNIKAELDTSWEAMLESMRPLHQSVVYNLHWIEMTLVVQRDQSRDEGELEVGGSGEAEESEGRAEEWTE